MGVTILTKQGVDVCNGDYFSKWLEEPNPLDPGKTNHQSAADSPYGQGPMRDFKRKQYGNYRVAMGRRFGWHALNFLLDGRFCRPDHTGGVQLDLEVEARCQSCCQSCRLCLRRRRQQWWFRPRCCKGATQSRIQGSQGSPADDKQGEALQRGPPSGGGMRAVSSLGLDSPHTMLTLRRLSVRELPGQGRGRPQQWWVCPRC